MDIIGKKFLCGFGLSNIERVTKNYSGKLQLSCKDKVFTARTTIMLAV